MAGDGGIRGEDGGGSDGEREREREMALVCGVAWFSCARRSPILFVGLQRLSSELRLS